ncbi:MAG: CDP-alcohol phosphatidyltransferase family protein [Tannerella sp.]|jgi:CDP-diacylglycerol--serine O-phosphatidyltransferase|nr:CDP-alcohol phosphatidyltransferase family protein [Tannerella sp.]
MKSIVRHIPNTLTCISLAFGFYAAILGISGDYSGAMIAIFIAAIFDFSDGLAARLLKAYSAMGKELDSLADIISFGVAPGMMLFSFLDKLLYTLSWNDSWICKLFLLAAFAIPVFSGLRLAKFNIDERQKTSFIGFPVPAHAILWSSLIVALSPAVIIYGDDSYGIFQLSQFITSITPEALLIGLSIAAVATSLLLVSEIPMFSLKISSFTWKENKLQYILILSAILLITLFGIIGISATILLYILLSVISYQDKSKPQ